MTDSLKELCITKLDGDRQLLASLLDVPRTTIDKWFSKGKKVVELKDGGYMTVSDYDIKFEIPELILKQAG